MFNFGKNWQDYSQRILDARSLQSAKESIQALLKVESLDGLSMIDLGCGSGLFSVAATQLGAQVTAADVNPLCLKVTQDNASRLLSDPTQINVRLLSALDKSALEMCGTFDVVYSWGVLHHTGAMWKAIENSLSLVKPSGQYVISIYNKHITSSVWRAIKYTYVHSPELIQRAMVYVFACVIYVAKLLVTRQNPLKKERGMDFWYDVIDWVGGYPYEFATVDEINQFVSARGFSLVRVVKATTPTGCNEFVFARNRSQNSTASAK